MNDVNHIYRKGLYALIDGASGIGFVLSKESQELQRTLLNNSKSQIERLEAYEDIFNPEVGDTGLSRARNIERESGLRQIFLKFEGGNPTGIQKDRIAFAQCLDALRRGFATLYKRGKTSRIPWIIAGSSYRKNPIVYSYKKNLPFCTGLEPGHIHETKTSDPLINWHSYDGDEALDAIRNSSGWAEDISDSSLNNIAKILKDKEGLSVISASTAGLAALLSKQHLEPLEGDRYVAIITGRK